MIFLRKCLTYTRRKICSCFIQSFCTSYILCSNSGIVPSSAISQNSNISRALDYIKNNLQTVNLDELSKYLHLNKNYLCRQFKLETGLTVMEHVKLQRITLAKEKLIQTDMSIADIVDSIWFSNISYFCNLFKPQLIYLFYNYNFYILYY